jgi:hypothetical protein
MLRVRMGFAKREMPEDKSHRISHVPLNAFDYRSSAAAVRTLEIAVFHQSDRSTVGAEAVIPVANGNCQLR